MSGHVKPKEPPAESSSSYDGEKMAEMAGLLEEVFEGQGFLLLVYPFGEGETDVKLVSNASAESAKRILLRFLAEGETK